MTVFRLIRGVAAIAMVCLTGAACTSTTAPSAADSGIRDLEFRTETFSGTLQVNGSGFYSFFVGQAGPAELTLAAIQTPGGAALSTPVGIGVGVPSGTGCPRTTSKVASPGLTAQLTVTLNPGTYCVAVFDAGNLTSSVTFAMRFRHP